MDIVIVGCFAGQAKQLQNATYFFVRPCLFFNGNLQQDAPKGQGKVSGSTSQYVTLLTNKPVGK